jgi:8-oxo-dGTP diphosphatase
VKIRRARVVMVAASGRVAMIERYVNGRTFLSVPGGRLEPGESPEQAAVREIHEELGLRVTLAGRLADLDQQAYFLAVVPEESPLFLSGPELRHASARNRYTPRWVNGTTLDGLPLRQAGVRPLLTAAVLAVAATMTVTDLSTVAATESPDRAESATPDKTVIEPDGIVIDRSTESMAPGLLVPSPARRESNDPVRILPWGLRSRFIFHRRGSAGPGRRDDHRDRMSV